MNTDTMQEFITICPKCATEIPAEKIRVGIHGLCYDPQKPDIAICNIHGEYPVSELHDLFSVQRKNHPERSDRVD